MFMTVQVSMDPRRRSPPGRPVDCRFNLSGQWLGSIALCVLLTFPLSSQAHASCGDYLEHGPNHSSAFDADFQVALVKLVPEQPVEGRCRQGNCQKQAPVHAPTEDHVRVDNRRSDMMGPGSDLTTPNGQQFGIAADQQTSPQAILDVAVPPPRF